VSPSNEEDSPENAIEPKLFDENHFVKTNADQPYVDTKGPRIVFMIKIKLTYQKRELIFEGDVTSNHIIRILWDLVFWSTIILKAA
jgi:hypothetical protein